MLDIQVTSYPMLETNRLTLRRITLDDADTLFSIRTHPQVLQYLGRDGDKDVAAVMKLIEIFDNNLAAGDGITWGIARRGETELIGVVNFWRIDKTNHRAEVGYMLAPKAWQQGVMTETLQTVLDYGFTVLNFHSVEANTSVDNLASQAVLFKCGFVQEGHIRENWYYNGQFSDSLIFSKLAGKNDQ